MDRPIAIRKDQAQAWTSQLKKKALGSQLGQTDCSLEGPLHIAMQLQLSAEYMCYWTNLILQTSFELINLVIIKVDWWMQVSKCICIFGA